MKFVMISFAALLSLSAFASCPGSDRGGLCTGQNVISETGLKGTVVGVFGNSDVMVKFDGYSSSYKWQTDKLAVTEGCTKKKKFCVGDPIYSTTDLKGTIQGIFKNDKVAIKFDGHSGFHNWSTDQLSKLKGCIQGRYCVGKEVISDTGLLGKIVALNRTSKKLSIKFNGHSGVHQWSAEQLSLTYGCSSADYCIGDQVINTNGLNGTIAAIHPTGDVFVKFDGHPGFHKWNTSQLAITNACSERPQYNEVADESEYFEQSEEFEG